MKIAVNEPPEGEVEDPKPPARLGRGGSISCCSKGRSFEKKFSHATLANDEGGGLAGVVPALARRVEEDLTLTRGDTAVESTRFSAVGAFEEEEEAAEPLLPEDDEFPPLEGEELLEDLDDEDESTDVETRRDGERVDREPQLEMKVRADGATAAEGPAIAGALLLCALTCLSSARAWIERPRIFTLSAAPMRSQMRELTRKEEGRSVLVRASVVRRCDQSR